MLRSPTNARFIVELKIISTEHKYTHIKNCPLIWKITSAGHLTRSLAAM